MGAAQVGDSSHRSLVVEQALEAEEPVADAGQQRDAVKEVAQRYRNWTSDAD
jgi:hypothetical protein